MKQANETIKYLMQKIEEKDKINQSLIESFKKKSEECEKLEQEVKNMKEENKILDTSKLLEDLISMQQVNLDKTGLGFQLGMCLNQNDKKENKEVKAEVEKKLEDERNFEIRILMQEGHQFDNLMQKGTHLLMATIFNAIDLDIIQ